MSSGKWIITIVFVILVGCGIYWLLKMPSAQPVNNQQNTDVLATTTSTTSQLPKPGSLTSSSTDVTDATLNADTSAVDAQVKALTTDISGIDKSINDKPVTQ